MEVGGAGCPGVGIYKDLEDSPSGIFPDRLELTRGFEI